MIIMDFAKAFEKVTTHEGTVLFSYGIRGLEDLLTSRSFYGSLSALKTWYWMVTPQMQSRSYLVSPKKLYGMPRECHNKIMQPIPSTKRKRTPFRTETTYLQVNDSRKNSFVFSNRGN